MGVAGAGVSRFSCDLRLQNFVFWPKMQNINFGHLNLPKFLIPQISKIVDLQMQKFAVSTTSKLTA